MNHVLKLFIEKFIVVYFDDILIDNHSREEYMDHLQQVLTILQDNKLYANLKKYDFLTNWLIFLRFIMSTNGIHINEEKIHVVQEWPALKTIIQMRSFYDFMTFYRRFIRNFSNIVAPTTNYLNKENFLWIDVTEKSFIKINEKLTTTLVLSHEGRPIIFFNEKLSETHQKWFTYE